MISAPFELEQAEFRILIPGIPLPEKSQKECNLLHILCEGNKGAKCQVQNLDVPISLAVPYRVHD